MKLAILCSGQAAQHRGMFDEVLDRADCAGLRGIASEVLGEEVGSWWRSLDEGEIFSNANAQFAIALYQLAVWARIQPVVPRPAVIAGYSLGELLAWHVAGALDALQTLTLVRVRARLMDRCASELPRASGRGCMVLWRKRSTPARRAARERAMAEHGLRVAIHRSRGELVLGGSEAAVDAFTAGEESEELKRLCVSVPSHTHWLEGAVGPLRDALEGAGLSDPPVPVLAGIDGSVLRSRTQALDYLPAQIAHALRWDWCEETMASLGVDRALELGPGSDLARSFEAASPGNRARSAAEFRCVADLDEWLRRP